MKKVETKLLMLGLSTTLACAPEGANEHSEVTTAVQSAEVAPNPICIEPLVDVVPRRSLTVTDHNVLIPSQGGRDFSLARVLTQLAAQNGSGGPDAVELFRQLWDTQNPHPGLGFGFNCTDSSGAPSVVNGFDYGCRTVEGDQALNDPVRALGNYEAVALVNRFDLAPKSGEHCGEYRIVFENGRNVFSQAFLIMEAVLPNPNPSCGVAACRPVQEMWASLTSINDPATRADLLEEFYFDGLPGFAPVVHFEHFLDVGPGCGYGCATPGQTGQFRTNAFMQSPWMLKEFKLQRTCGKERATPCDLDFVPVSVKDNPFPDFFDPNSTHAATPEFADHFGEQIACLSANDVNRFGYCGLSDRFNHNESAADFVSNYETIFSQPGSSQLRDVIEEKLEELGVDLEPEHIVARAEALSCKGCHNHSNNADLGGGVTFPSSMSFFHNSEFVESGPDGDRFSISSALTGTFLPFREGVMEEFLSRSACITCGQVSLVSAGAGSTAVAPSATTISGARAVH